MLKLNTLFPSAAVTAAFAYFFTGTASAYLPIKATYNGLFYEPDGAWQQSAGTVTLTTTASGSYSGLLLLGPYPYRFTGTFDAQGQTTVVLSGSGLPVITLDLQADSQDPDLIYGTVSENGWSADLIMDRAVYDGKNMVCPDAGQYTLLIPRSFQSTDQPGGNSFGTIKVTTKGTVRLAASMADGWKLTQAAIISKGGQWPLFASLYSGEGVLWSWMLFNGSADDDLSGDITWIKPELGSDWYYPQGFAIQVYSWGSHYRRPPKGTPILNLTQGAIEFNGGDLYQNLTNQVVLDAKSKVINHGPAELSMKFSLSNGLVKGKFRDPSTSKLIPFQGVALQSYGVASGFFPGYTQTGEVWLEQW